MKVDQHKLRELLSHERPEPSADELRREENVFFVGGNLPERQTLETLFESHFQCNASLFHLTFGDLGAFQNGEALARMIKKNFNAHLVGRFNFSAPSQLIERAYAAGVDILDIPLTAFDASRSGRKERLRSIESARSVFPRWSVVSTLVAGEEPLSSTAAGIDTLLAEEVLPLVTLSKRAAGEPAEAVSSLFTHLHAGWRGRRALIKPLLPLVYLSAPFVPTAARGRLRGFIDIIDDKRLLATSDLRRLLRVKEVEESYASSGL